MTALIGFSQADVAAAGGSDAALRAFLLALPDVDQVGVEARAAGLGTRSIKTSTKSAFIDLAISMIDLTTLEGADTPGKVRALCTKAQHPDPSDDTVPHVAAVCVYGDMVPYAKDALRDSDINIAAVATAFPSGRASLDVKILDTRDAVANGADEIDMVIDRGAFLSGRYMQVFEQIKAVKEACDDAHLKVILETGVLVDPTLIDPAAVLAVAAWMVQTRNPSGLSVTPSASYLGAMVLLVTMDWVNPDGTVNLFSSSGQSMVMGNTAATFGLQTDTLDPSKQQLVIKTLGNSIVIPDSMLGGGEIDGADTERIRALAKRFRDAGFNHAGDALELGAGDHLLRQPDPARQRSRTLNSLRLRSPARAVDAPCRRMPSSGQPRCARPTHHR